MKKKFIIFIFLLLTMFCIPSVYAAPGGSVSCSYVLGGVIINPLIPKTVHTIIIVIKIAVPILLVIFGMLDLFKGITAQKEDEIKKGQQMFIKRLVSAAIIFFVISIVQLLIRFFANDESGIMICFNCFINGKC